MQSRKASATTGWIAIRVRGGPKEIGANEVFRIVPESSSRGETRPERSAEEVSEEPRVGVASASIEGVASGTWDRTR